MRKLLFLLLLLSKLAYGQVTIPQCSTNYSNSSSKITSISTTLSATTSGSLIYVAVKEGYNTTDTFTVTDSSSQVYSNVGYLNNSNERANVFYFPNSASITTVTASFTTTGGISGMGSGGAIGITACEIKGIVSSSPADGANSSLTSSSVASIISGPLTISHSSDILIYTVFPSGNFTSVISHTVGSKVLVSNSSANTIVLYTLTPYMQNNVTSFVTWSSSVNGACTWFTAFKALTTTTPVGKRSVVVF